jgi:N-acetylmuramic acid 6-phosphate etherase
VAVDIPTDAEFLTGSTRLSAGTATKIALNLMSTLAVIRLGKVRDNLMIDVKARNAKLRDRAARIVMELTGWEKSRAETALVQHGWDIRSALAANQSGEAFWLSIPLRARPYGLEESPP